MFSALTVSPAYAITENLIPATSISLSAVGTPTVDSVLTVKKQTYTTFTETRSGISWFRCNSATTIKNKLSEVDAALAAASCTQLVTADGVTSNQMTTYKVTAKDVGKHMTAVVSANDGVEGVNAGRPNNDGYSLANSLLITSPPAPPAKKNPKLPAVATKLNVGKSLTVALHATKGTSAKGANADGLPTVVSVTSASKAFCSVTKVVKNSKITGYTVKGLKVGSCSVVVDITGDAAFNAQTKTTTVMVAKNAPKVPTVANKVNVKKSFTVKLHATKGTSAKGANSDGLPTVVSVAPASKAFCSVTKVVKNKKITGYSITGLKAGNCSVVVTITGNGSFNKLTKTTVVKVSN